MQARALKATGDPPWRPTLSLSSPERTEHSNTLASAPLINSIRSEEIPEFARRTSVWVQDSPYLSTMSSQNGQQGFHKMLIRSLVVTSDVVPPFSVCSRGYLFLGPIITIVLLSSERRSARTARHPLENFSLFQIRARLDSTRCPSFSFIDHPWPFSSISCHLITVRVLPSDTSDGTCCRIAIII